MYILVKNHMMRPFAAVRLHRAFSGAGFIIWSAPVCPHERRRAFAAPRSARISVRRAFAAPALSLRGCERESYDRENYTIGMPVWAGRKQHLVRKFLGSVRTG